MSRRSGGPMPGFDARDRGSAPIYGAPHMRYVYGAPFAEATPQVGPLPGWGPPNPVVIPMLVPLRGHPHVWAKSVPDGSSLLIDCLCKACGATYGRDCEFPPKSGSWIAAFAAKHCHGDQACQEAWEYEYHTGLHRLRAAYPTQG